MTPCCRPASSRARRRASARLGLTLLELTIVMGILSVAVAVLLRVSLGVGDTGNLLQTQAACQDEARQAIIAISKELRQAALETLSTLPAAKIQYRIATDLDGNGAAVDGNSRIELSPLHSLRRDVSDSNLDGIVSSQLVLTTPTSTRVLANALVPDEDVNGNGKLDSGEDTDGNGILDHGVWFELLGPAVKVTVQIQGMTRDKHSITVTQTETVQPRN